MSRAKAKLAIVHDLQNKQHDVILTKKDCDMIYDALWEKYGYLVRNELYFFLKGVGKL